MGHPQASETTLLNLETLAVRQISTVAIHPEGNRCYLGVLAGGGHQRENLAVVDLSDSGSPVSEPRWYADSTEALLMGHIATVVSILPDPARSKLYLATTGSPVAPDFPVTVYDLVGGDPSGAPR